MTDFPTQSSPASGLERGAIESSDRSLRENDMLPWIGGITKAGGLGVMAGYPEVEDVPAHGFREVDEQRLAAGNWLQG